ncbi:MAG TPA: tetratricopeptide repeat protein [Rudaea sp.]|nr:tetratricopeptide repeat protein [Rudaea sp.]
MSFFAEIKRRNVIRMAGMYLVVAWLIVQVTSTILPMYSAPEWLPRTIVTLLAIGLLPTLVFAWAYELTPEGLKRDSEVPRELSIAPATGRRMDRIIMAVLALGLAYFAFDKFVLAPRLQKADVAGISGPDAKTDAKSIAVLPFADLSQAKDQEYFSDGMSEELLNVLANVPGLHVVGRTSSFAFKGRNEDLRAIGQKLGVAQVLEGSVRKSGDRVRITAQLIDVANGYHLWSETYDRQLTDVFALQDEISKAVVEALKLRLLPEQRQGTRAARTTSVEAHNEYLIGRQLQNRGNPDDARRAAERFEKAIELDSNYAGAYAALTISELSKTQFARSPDEAAKAQSRAQQAIARAFELDADLPEAYSARATFHTVVDWDWKAAESDAQRALQLSPNDADVVRRAATTLVTAGREDEAIAALRRSIELDPLAASSWSNLGYYLICQGRYEEARAALVRTLEITGGTNVLGSYNLGTVWLLEGKPEQALAQFEQIPEGQYFRLVGIAMAQHSLGHAQRSKEALDALIALPAPPPVWIAAVHGWRGEHDEAFAWLDRAVAEKNYFVRNVRYDAVLAKLRDDSRYPVFLGKIGFK